MTDQTIPAGLTRDEANAARAWAERSLTMWDPDVPVSKAARVVLAALPTPQRPTLADMTPEERAACQWMQADVANRSVRYVIANPFDEDSLAGLIDHDGDICWLSPERITPRPDLPRLEWPGDETPAPAPTPALPGGWRLADHPRYGRIIVTTPEPDVCGVVYFVRPTAADHRGFDWHFYDPDALTYIDQEADQ